MNHLNLDTTKAKTITQQLYNKDIIVYKLMRCPMYRLQKGLREHLVLNQFS